MPPDRASACESSSSIVLIRADGHAERSAALDMIHRHSPGSTRQLTVGADKRYDAAEFAADLRRARVTPPYTPRSFPRCVGAAAGLTPVLHPSGKSHAIRRGNSRDKALKRVFFQSAFVGLCHLESKAIYDRKRAEGKRHNQAIIALARRRINVIWAMLNTRQPSVENFKRAD